MTSSEPFRLRQQVFIVLATQRSGSNWLEDRLDSASSIVMHRSEVFRRTLQQGGYREWASANRARSVGARVVPGWNKHRYIESLRPPTNTERAGFRVMYDQLRRNPSLLAPILVQRVPVIHLVRENVLSTYVSTLAARQTGRYITRSNHKPSPPVVVDCANLLDELDRRYGLIERHRKLLRWADHHEVSFERYVAQPDTHDARVLEFLGLAPDTLESDFRPQGRGGVRDRIANIDQVERALSGSRFESLLDVAEPAGSTT